MAYSVRISAGSSTERKVEISEADLRTSSRVRRAEETERESRSESFIGGSFFGFANQRRFADFNGSIRLKIVRRKALVRKEGLIINGLAFNGFSKLIISAAASGQKDAFISGFAILDERLYKIKLLKFVVTISDKVRRREIRKRIIKRGCIKSCKS